MAQNTLTLKLSVKLPWWSGLYIGLAKFNHSVGIPVDPKTVGETIGRHVKIKVSTDG